MPPSFTTETRKVATPCGEFYVHVGADGRPWFKVEPKKPNGCLGLLFAVTSGLGGRALEAGVSLEELAAVLAGHECHQSGPGRPSCASAIAAELRAASGQPRPEGRTTQGGGVK